MTTQKWANASEPDKVVIEFKKKGAKADFTLEK